MAVSQFSVALVALFLACACHADELAKKKHHHKHHHKHVEKQAVSDDVAATDTKVKASSSDAKTVRETPKEEQIMNKMKTLETELAKKEEAVKGVVTKGRIEVNGPLPADFAERFSQGVAKATGCDPSEVKVIETNPVVALLQTKAKAGDVVELRCTHDPATRDDMPADRKVKGVIHWVSAKHCVTPTSVRLYDYLLQEGKAARRRPRRPPRSLVYKRIATTTSSVASLL